MIYLSLYRKYRPVTFEDVISQPHITRTLKNQLETKQTAHAYLFTGSRGTGKTTCAKILAKALNCTDLKDGNPCLVCENCRLIDEGTPDIVEIDAASNNGVDDVRALRDEINYSPVSCKYRVYIIDEVHMLSTNAFNALLKTVEEPPSHVVFILATTETHKVPATIVSRCQRFEFRRINLEESTGLLLKIASKENIQLDENAAALISRLSDGGMRDALNLLDTCSSSTSETTQDLIVTVKRVSECAGIAGKEHLFAISEAIITHNSGAALEVLDSLHSRSRDMMRLVEEMIFHYRNLMLLKIMPSKKTFSGMLTLLPQDSEDYKSLCGKLPLEDIMRSIHILEECFEKMGRSGNRKLLAEMCFIRLCEPRLDSNEKALLARIGALEEKLETLSAGGSVTATKPLDIIKTDKQIKSEIKASDTIISEAIISDTIINTEKTKTTEPKDKIPPVSLISDYIPDSFSENSNNNMPDMAYVPSYNDYDNDNDNNNNNNTVNVVNNAVSTDVKEVQTAQDVPVLSDKINSNTFLGWGDALNLLPDFLSGMLEDADVSLNDGVLVMCGSDLMKGIISNPDNNVLVLAAVKKIVSDINKIEFIEKKSGKKEEVDRVKEFLDMVKREGVELKIR